MSHSNERAEKVCLNCGTAPLFDRYCQHCGQENAEPRQTLGHLIAHFFADVTHFDGKFFSTLKLLLLKPGFLSSEYVKGRRTKYLDPIRMYLFISAIFFVLVYSRFGDTEQINRKDAAAIHFMDSTRAAEQSERNAVTFELISQPGIDKQMSLMDLPDMLEHGTAYYDSVQLSLPESRRRNFFQRYLDHEIIGIYQTYDTNPYNFIPNAFNLFIHSFSKLFFISLPLFAFFLWLLYVRRRKQWYYVSHAIFTLHYYSVSFILLAALLLIYEIPMVSIEVCSVIAGIITVILVAYLYIAMLRYYGQHWFKTLVKFLLLSFINSVAMILLLTVMFVNAVIHAH